MQDTQEMVFQLAVVDAPLEIRIEPSTGDLLVEFPGRHRAVSNRRIQVRFKPEAAKNLRAALLGITTP
ncbi:hypothetical protein D3C78_1985920 [compost metagenome]